MSTTPNEIGCLALLLGGTGALAARALREQWIAEGQPFPLHIVIIDTDMANNHFREEGLVDDIIPIRFKYDEVQTIKATPWSFGDIVPRIVSQVADMLDPEELEHGARTLRSLAQLFWAVRRLEIASILNRCCRDFLRQAGCKSIIPIGATSTGGGTGSAFSVLLAAALIESTFRGRLLQGLPSDLLRSFVLFAVEPFYRAFANEDDPNHTARILANAMSFRIETEYLERRGCFASICHQGLSNSGGAVQDSEREVSRVLGTSLYQYMRYWALHIKPRKVDRPASSRYRGQDIPELVSQRLRTASLDPISNGQSKP